MRKTSGILNYKHNTICAMIEIGNSRIIDVNSIFKSEFPNNSVVAVFSARVIKTIDEYLEKIKDKSLLYSVLSSSEKENAKKSL